MIPESLRRFQRALTLHTRLLVEDEHVALDSSGSKSASSAMPVISCPIRSNQDMPTVNAMIMSLLKERFRFHSSRDVGIEFVKMFMTPARQSWRYPGLMEAGQVRYFECEVTDEVYEPSGYTWRRQKFITRYRWLPLRPTVPEFRRY